MSWENVIWLKTNDWVVMWNKNKTGVLINSPFNENGTIWFPKHFYKESKYGNDKFGLEVAKIHWKTGEISYYDEVINWNDPENKIVNNYDGETLFNEYKKYEEIKKSSTDTTNASSEVND